MNKDIRHLNIRSMLTIAALKDNDFHIFNTCIELDTEQSNVSRIIKLVESYFNYPIFTKGKKKWCGDRLVVNGFTDKGVELYQSIMIFLNSLNCMGIFEEAA